MPQFAKLFGPESDQVLVLFDEGDEGPHVKIYCQPPGLGVCATTLGFPEKSYASVDEAWNKAEACFAEMDEARATNLANALKASASQFAE